MPTQTTTLCTHRPQDPPPWWRIEQDGKRDGLRGRKLRTYCERRWDTYGQSCDGSFTGLTGLVSDPRPCASEAA